VVIDSADSVAPEHKELIAEYREVHPFRMAARIVQYRRIEPQRKLPAIPNADDVRISKRRRRNARHA